MCRGTQGTLDCIQVQEPCGCWLDSLVFSADGAGMETLSTLQVRVPIMFWTMVSKSPGLSLLELRGRALSELLVPRVWLARSRPN